MSLRSHRVIQGAPPQLSHTELPACLSDSVREKVLQTCVPGPRAGNFHNTDFPSQSPVHRGGAEGYIPAVEGRTRQPWCRRAHRCRMPRGVLNVGLTQCTAF